MNHHRPLHPHSREARHQQDACCNPPCRNSRLDGKISRCRDCVVTIYCSGACQKAHWPEHRDHCETIQAQNKTSEEVARTYSSAPVSLVQVNEELHAFSRRFGPLLLASAVNWFRPDHRNPVIRSWEEDCLFLVMRRRPNVSDSVPSWARFEVDTVERYSYEIVDAELAEFPGYASGGYQKEREKHIKEAKRRGPGNGVFYIWFYCGVDVGDGLSSIPVALPLFFSPEVAKSDCLPPGLTPKDYFKTGVNVFSRLAAQGRIRNT